MDLIGQLLFAPALAGPWWNHMDSFHAFNSEVIFILWQVWLWSKLLGFYTFIWCIRNFSSLVASATSLTKCSLCRLHWKVAHKHTLWSRCGCTSSHLGLTPSCQKSGTEYICDLDNQYLSTIKMSLFSSHICSLLSWWPEQHSGAPLDIVWPLMTYLGCTTILTSSQLVLALAFPVPMMDKTVEWQMDVCWPSSKNAKTDFFFFPKSRIPPDHWNRSSIKWKIMNPIQQIPHHQNACLIWSTLIIPLPDSKGIQLNLRIRR